MPGPAIVTGGGRGIGAATARLLAEAGHNICVNYASDQTRAESVAETCHAFGVAAEAVQADISYPASVEAVFVHCDQVFSPPTVLVSNAGIIGDGL